MPFLLLLLIGLLPLAAQPQHGVRPQRMVIRGATVVEGNGTPADGPMDIAIENGVITAVGRAAARPGDVVIVSGPIGDHGVAVLSQIISDVGYMLLNPRIRFR